MKSVKLVCGVIIFVANIIVITFAIYWIISRVKDDSGYADCNVSMSEEEIESFSVAYARENLQHVSPDGLAYWDIIEKVPLARSEAESEFEMVKYEVTAEGPTDKMELMIGRCRKVINFYWGKK